MAHSPSLEQIKTAENAKIEFDDYVRFRVPSDVREEQVEGFLQDKIYTPSFEYPKLNQLYDLPESGKDPLVVKRENAQGAVFQLEAAVGKGVVPDAELEMYADFQEQRLLRMALVQNAWLLGHAGSGSTVEIAQQAFMRVNEQLFGSLDTTLALGMIGTEVQRAQQFIPKTEAAEKIQAELIGYFDDKEFEHVEPELMSQDDLSKLHEYVSDRYADVLAVVRDTDDTVFYDATDCQKIMQDALVAGGMDVQGWTIEIKDTASAPSSNITTKKISLPPNTRRNANGLRRLIVHEQENHSRRGQNGEDAGIKLLKLGSANYADVEEGLGLILECAVDGTLDSPAITRARDRYITAGLALGVDGPARDARQTFGVLWRMLAVRNSKDGSIDDAAIMDAKKQAYDHIENAYRGTNYAMPGIIYTKLKVYYEGLKKNADFFAAHIDDLDTAFDSVMRGKYDHTDPIETARVDELLAA